MKNHIAISHKVKLKVRMASNERHEGMELCEDEIQKKIDVLLFK